MYYTVNTFTCDYLVVFNIAMKNELLWVFHHDVFIHLCFNKSAENAGFGQV